MATPLQCPHYPFPGNGFLTQDLYQSHSRYHCTRAHIKSSNHMLRLPVAISYRQLNCWTHALDWIILSYNGSWLYKLCTDHTENTAPLLFHGADHAENTVSSTVAWCRLHRKHITWLLPQLCDITVAVQAMWTQRKHCCCIVGSVCCGHCLAMDLHVTVYSQIPLSGKK
jgi:hypothetical protein